MRTISLIYESENGNYGDIVIGKCMKKLIQTYLVPSKIIAIPVSLDYEKPTFCYHSEEILEIANNSDLIIVGGGGILTYIFDNIPIEKFTKSYVCYALGDNTMTKNFAGTFRGNMPDDQFELFKSRYQKMIYNAKFFSVRTDGSKIFMNIPVNESADPAKWAGRFFSGPKPIAKDYVLINIAGYDMNKRYNISESKMTEILDNVADYLLDHDLIPVFICHRQRDFILNRTDVMKIEWNEIMRNFEKGLAWYEHAEFVIGTRGHSQLIPFGYAVPFINIASQAKNIGFMKMYDLEDCMLDSFDFSVENLIEKINYVMINKTKISNKIKLKLESLWQATDEEWKLINHRVCPKLVKVAYMIEFHPRDTQWHRAFEKYMEWQRNRRITFGDIVIQPSYFEFSQSMLNVYSLESTYWNDIREADLVFCYTTPFNLSWKWYMLPVLVKSIMKPEAKLVVQFDTDLRWVFDSSWRLKYWKEIKHDEVKDIQDPKEFFEKTQILEAGDAYFTVIDDPPFAPYTTKPVIYMPLPQSIRVEVYRYLDAYKPDHNRKYLVAMNHSPEKSSAEHSILNVFKQFNMPVLYFIHNRISFSQLDGLLKIKALNISHDSQVIGWIPFGKGFLDYLNKGFVAIDDCENYGGWSRFTTECIVAQIPVIGSTLAVKEFFPELYTKPKDYEQQIKLIHMLQSSKTFYHRIMAKGKENFLTKLDPVTLVRKMLDVGINLGCSYAIPEHEFVQQREYFIRFLYDIIKSGQAIPMRPPEGGCTTFDSLTNRSLSREDWEELYGRYASFMNDREEFRKCKEEAIRRINP